jgi:Domain of unknown function (DUF4265)
MTGPQHEFVGHQDPAWRERANFIINAELLEEDRPKRFEQLWARQLSGDEFEICCIPFALYDLALGDVVRTAPRAGRQYVVQRVIKASGRYVFRIWFGESFQPRNEIAERLKALGSLVEWSSRNLLAADAIDGKHAQPVADFLAGREKTGHLLYETGRSLSTGAAAADLSQVPAIRATMKLSASSRSWPRRPGRTPTGYPHPPKVWVSPRTVETSP